MNLQSIGKVKVSLSPVQGKKFYRYKETWGEIGTVSSLRLDVMLAEMLHISRQKVQPFIKWFSKSELENSGANLL